MDCKVDFFGADWRGNEKVRLRMDWQRDEEQGGGGGGGADGGGEPDVIKIFA